MEIGNLEVQLNSFDLQQRKNALVELKELNDSNSICSPNEKYESNIHYHTFFSYNSEGWSPSRVAWEAKKYGLAVAGIVDFDVLDGMNEFLSAGEIIDLKTTASLETRVFISEYSDKEINSPKEPGVAYFMGCGFFKLPSNGSESETILSELRTMARERNLKMLEKVNGYLGAVQLDYDKDVLPLTPSGNATERHMLAAFDNKSRDVFKGNTEALIDFWANAFEISKEESEELLNNTPKFHEVMRSKLMKYGGVGYIAPTSDTFPSIEKVIKMIEGMGGLPTIAWLDGTSAGEADMPAFLSLLKSKGVIAINIIPDRNYNIKNPDEKKIKVDNLGKAIQAARDLDMPICVGTEMNKGGLPFVDDFNAPELKPYAKDFMDGAFFLWGHTYLAKKGFGYNTNWANTHFGNNVAEKNSFYTEVGKKVRPQTVIEIKKSDEVQPSDILNMI